MLNNNLFCWCLYVQNVDYWLFTSSLNQTFLNVVESEISFAYVVVFFKELNDCSQVLTFTCIVRSLLLSAISFDGFVSPRHIV